jgi:PAS domain S-box-containing protein/putative nucleotidyltransferase with HDIG domain
MLSDPDADRSKEQLLAELQRLRQRMNELAKIDAAHRDDELSWRDTVHKLEARNRQLNRILDVANSLLIDLDLDSLLDTMVKTARDSLGFNLVVLSLVEPTMSRTRVVATAGLGDKAREQLNASLVQMTWKDFTALLQERYRIGRCYFIPHGDVEWRAVQYRAATSRYEPTGDQPVLGKMAWHPQDAFFAVIELRQGNTYILLSVDQPFDNLRPGHEAFQSLEIFANLAAVAFENCRLYIQFQEELIQRRKVEKQLMDARKELELLVSERTAELKTTEEKYRSLMDRLSVGVFRNTADEKGRFIDVNPAVVRMFGYESSEEFMKCHIIDLYNRPEDREKLRMLVRSNTLVRNEEFLFKKRNGSPFWGAITAMGKFDENGALQYIDGIIEDITSRKLAEESIRESEEKYRNLVERANDGIVIVQDGIIKYANPRLAEIFGYTADEIVGTRFTQHVHPDEVAVVVDRYKRRMEGEKVESRYEMIIKHKEGSMLNSEINAGMIAYQGKPADLIFVRDITQQVRDQAELKYSLARLQELLSDTIKAIAKVVEMKDAYTAGHQRQVTKLACAIAQEMGLTSDQIEGIRLAGLVHDIGKISAPAEILSKPSELSEIEYALVKMHSQVGHDILKEINFPWPIAQILLQHHERYDGSGYPNGLRGEAILLEARVLGVADVVEAIAAHRPYRAALGIDAALDEILNKRGAAFDPVVVDACVRLFREKSYVLE